MNQQEMEDTSKVEKLSSAAAFVEGGIQDACDDACSICLESFSESDPSTVTGCKHEYHLQCILEWCQRSSQCPMCWESISLKDPTSQELLEAVERERSFRQRQPRTTTIFRHPTLGDFELQHVLPVDASEADLEERIIQHLAAAASMGRPHISRREGHRGRSRGHGRPQYLVFSSHPNSPPFGPSASSGQIAGENDHGSITNAASPSVPVVTLDGSPPLQVSSTQDLQIPTLSSSYGQNTSVNQDRAGPSDLQSFSESLKSRFNAVSTRYKESIIKSTRGWRERLFSRNQSVSDVHSEFRRNDPGVETVSHGIANLDMRESSRGASTTVGQRTEEHLPTLPTAPETHTEFVPDDTRGPSASSSTASELN